MPEIIKYDVFAMLEVHDQENVYSDGKKRMCIIPLECKKEEAVQKAYEYRIGEYEKINKRCEIKDNELYVYFEDGFYYRYHSPEVIEVLGDVTYRLRTWNKALKKAFRKTLKLDKFKINK